MSINPNCSLNLSAAYEAFDELLPHMNDIRKLETLECLDEDMYQSSGLKLAPVLQKALDKVEDVLREQGFFSDEFNAAIAKTQQNSKHTAELEQNIRELRKEPATALEELYDKYSTAKTFPACDIALSYMTIISEEGFEDNPKILEFIRLVQKVSKTFDDVITASIRKDDAEFLCAAKKFSIAYAEVIDFAGQHLFPENIKSLELELDEARARYHLENPTQPEPSPEAR